MPEICPKMHSRRTIDWRYGSPADGTIAEGDDRWDDARKRGQVRFVLTRAQDMEKDGKNAAEKAAKAARRPPPSFLLRLSPHPPVLARVCPRCAERWHARALRPAVRAHKAKFQRHATL